MKKGTKQDITQSFNVAIEGIIETIRTERNMKFHAFCTILVLMISIFLGVSRMELIVLSISMSLVLAAELLNTAIESFVDLVSPDYNLLAKRAKDVGAGAVFIAATNALIVGYLVFHKRIAGEFASFFDLLKESYANVIVFLLIFLVILVISIKSFFKKGTPLRGGIPSGHSALGGALFVGIFFLTDDVRIFYLSLFLLILVLQSRVEGKIHTVLETIIGAVLGMGVTYIFLSILKI
ncbi:diacylglycerol kinase [Cetobacterium sp.]|uniref:diacylglycerol kinase n=1 Tax=Cetobacterium sp. TaxID=2071632 RepID=UPI0025E4D88F|nr:diacylglycerol kinase [uncultured Cetobacterium sp.]